MPRFGCINVHASLLPRWRGATPIQHAILAGDIETGVTIIKMDTGVDTGKILYKASCPILKKDTSITLCDKLSYLGSIGLIKILNEIAKRGTIQSEVQNESMVTYAKKISRHDARINWFLPAVQIERCVRAFKPWPISWTEMNRQLIKIWHVSVVQNKEMSINVRPGTIIKVDKQGIQVATLAGVINLESIQLAGKRPVSIKDLLNAYNKLFTQGNLLI